MAAKMDTFFVSHGSPLLSIDDSIPARGFFKLWKSQVLRVIPKTILVVSAHWETYAPTVNVIYGLNDTIYDFRGFPKPMYELKYPARRDGTKGGLAGASAPPRHRRSAALSFVWPEYAKPAPPPPESGPPQPRPPPGAPKVARRVKELLQGAGFGPVEEEKARGLDHGSWVPLMFMYPEANIPVCQLSIQTMEDGTYHYNMGKALAPLRDEGVLIVGSGSATHNLRATGPDDAPIVSWALEFDAWLTNSLMNGRHEDVNNYEDKAPHAKMAHPTPDHFYPLHVALGAAGEQAKAELIHASFTESSLSYSSYRFYNI